MPEAASEVELNPVTRSVADVRRAILRARNNVSADESDNEVSIGVGWLRWYRVAIVRHVLL